MSKLSVKKYILTRRVKGNTWFSYFVINILSLTAQLDTNLMSRQAQNVYNKILN